MAGSSATSQQSVIDAKKRLTRFIKTLDTVPTQVLKDESERILMEAKNEAPYDTGKLENSIRVKVSHDKRRPGLLISASARDNGYNYAGIQHENSQFRHPVKGKYHYLKDPFDRGTDRIIRRLRKEVKF